jgi:hypothetical protein
VVCCLEYVVPRPLSQTSERTCEVKLSSKIRNWVS